MGPDKLRKRLADHEDNFVERKSEGVTPAELRQTVCAFANTVSEGRVAVLFIGIHDKTGEITGVTDPDRLQKRLREACQGDCYPPIDYTAEVLDVNGKAVVAVVVPSSMSKPHFTGPAYVRVGSESPKASSQQYEELVLSRVDKARDIIKHKNDVFSVFGIGTKIGSHRPLPDAAYKEMRECRVTECTAQFVRLQDIAQGVNLSEPLTHVEFAHDEERHRPMLLVRRPRN